MTSTPNRLINERSPYLLQHAHNPVDWYAWGDEAFTKARNEDKPIFLSVGYSTCHWCHVMEKESFENEAIADILNRYFVAIKVDREERPDVDRVYMTALQAMGQNGGWPMSMFLTPDLKPFYGGTYFPPESRYGRSGFPEILLRIREIWEKERPKVTESAENLSQFLNDLGQTHKTEGKAVGTELLDHCYEQLRKTFDATFGGFGGGPKFPRPVVFSFLLRYYHRTGEDDALAMVEQTLNHMAAGGIYDHVGGGFHRYSVDGEWRVPHFEKMLYDQAQMAVAYAELYQVKHDPFHAAVLREILEYVLRDLTAGEGAFCSAEDADSPRPEAPEEKGEGAFYVWTKREIIDVLGEELARPFLIHYGVEEDGNAPFDPQHEFTGRNILYVAQNIDDTARILGITEDDVRLRLSRARDEMLKARAQRPRPHLDDKVLAGWNGLMISGLAKAAQALGEQRYSQAAVRAADFVMTAMYDRQERRLIRRYRQGEARFEAHLDDYAFLVQGLIDLYETSHETRWLVYAAELTARAVELFHDPTGGGFFDTTGRDPTILVRLKEQYDGAEPAGNSVMTFNLLRLAAITDNAEWENLAEQTFKAFASSLTEQPVAVPYMVAALDFFQSAKRQLFIAGQKDDKATEALFREIFNRYLPNKVVFFVDDRGEEQRQLAGLVPFADSLTLKNDKPTAYVCEGFVCTLPTNEPNQLGEQLTR